MASQYHHFFSRRAGRRSYASVRDVPWGEVPVPTPHLDALIARGTFFANFVVSAPWCVPSRGCLMTSRYPVSHGAYAGSDTDSTLRVS